MKKVMKNGVKFTKVSKKMDTFNKKGVNGMVKKFNKKSGFYGLSDGLSSCVDRLIAQRDAMMKDFNEKIERAKKAIEDLNDLILPTNAVAGNERFIVTSRNARCIRITNGRSTNSLKGWCGLLGISYPQAMYYFRRGVSVNQILSKTF